ncbi:MAG TPA: hypothetical protein PKZ70_08115, partial [Candidatus Atribacteria bacterium]|nr:hypothetical protein [Candidatus Atribacteria bacterium]
MRRKTGFSIFLVVVGVIVVLFGVSYFTVRLNYGILQGKVVDYYSGDVVKKLHLTIDGRSDILFQSKDYQFTNLPPGKH